MSALGEIYVILTAETGTFVSELSKAARSAQQTANEISRSFSGLQRVASQTFGAFGDFNPVISKLSFALSEAGAAASSAMKDLGKFPGILGPMAGLASGAAAGMASIALGAIGIAIASAESASKMYDLSRATGVSASSLAGWSFAAKQAGLDQQEVVRSLQLLSANMVKAAEAPSGAASNVFKILGLDIRQANGDLKNSGDMMVEVMQKLSAMKDQTAAVGLARQAMGRGGAQMLQMGDPAEIEKHIALFEKLNQNYDQAAAAAHQFSVTLGDLSEMAEAFGNEVMEDLLPSLQAIASSLAKAFENPAQINAWVKGITDLTKDFLALADTALMVARVMNASVNLAFSPWKIKEYAAVVEDAYGKNKQFLGDLFNPPPASFTPAPKTGPSVLAARSRPSPTASRETDVVAEMVGKLQAEAAAQLALASATEKSTSAALLAKAAADAEAKIAETRTNLLEREKTLRGELADAKAQEAAGVGSSSVSGSGGQNRAAQIEAQIGGIQRMLAELQKDAPQISALYAEIASGEFGSKASKDLEDFRVKTDEETAALQNMAAAFAKGPLAVAQATDAAKIAPFEKKLQDIGAQISGLKLLGAPAAHVAELQTSYDQLAGAIDRAKISVAAFTGAEIAEKIAKEKEQLSAEAQAYDVVVMAALLSAAAQREAAARAESIKFGAANPSASQSQLNEVYDTALAKLNEQRTETIAAAAAQYDLNASYDQEMEKLREIRSVLVANGASTLQVDTAMYDAKIKNLLDYRSQVFDAQNEELVGQQKIYDQAIQQAEAWDKAATSVGKLAYKMQAMVNELELEGQNMTGKFFDIFTKGISSLSDELAKFVITGKANFTSLLQSIAEQLLKAQIQKGLGTLVGAISGGGPKTGQVGPGGTPGIVPGPLGIGGALAGAFGVKLPGAPSAKGPCCGTAADPTKPKADAGGGGGDASGSSSFLSKLESMFSKVFSSISSVFSKLVSSLGSVISSIGSSIGGGFKSFLGLFGLARGGDVSAGQPYVVGENRAEVFVPREAGRIVPSIGDFLRTQARGSSSFHSSLASDVSSSAAAAAALKSGAGFSGLASLPRREYGGDVSAGKAYMVGERRPEVFMPRQSGSSQRAAEGGGNHQTVVQMHIHGVQDVDSFHRSQSQIMAGLHAQLTAAAYRNGYIPK